MRRSLGWLAVLMVVAVPLAAQTPTPEGTVITNTASVSWSDANGNSYTPVTASVAVTVAFQAGVDVTSAATATPASPSTGNELAFTITNAGNGVDSVSVATTPSAGVTVTGYRIGATPYATLAELNDALAGTAITAGSTVTVVVVYTVAAGRGGQSMPLALTATSRRDTDTDDSATTNVEPAASGGVGVSAGSSTAQRLPSNGTQYSASFTIQNTGNVSDTYTLSASVPGTVLTVVSVNGTAGSGGAVTVAADDSESITVVYTVANGAAAGASEALTLSATSDTDPGTTDGGTHTVTVIRAALAMTKEPFRDNQLTAIGALDTVVPDEFIWYRITITNNGGAAASTVSIEDELPAEVAYVSSAGDAAGWTIAEADGTVTASLAGTLAASASRFIWIRVQVR